MPGPMDGGPPMNQWSVMIRLEPELPSERDRKAVLEALGPEASAHPTRGSTTFEFSVKERLTEGGAVAAGDRMIITALRSAGFSEYDFRRDPILAERALAEPVAP